jgi:DNA-binding transcriptional MerR regulator
MAKSAEAFRTISEVSELLDTPAHVLRFWESRFSQVRPVKRAGGRRYYRPSDIALLGGIKQLLHDDGLTIRGVQKILREQGIKHVVALSPVTIDGDEDDAAVPAPATTRQADRAEPLTLWPLTPSPDPADAGDDLMPDPEDPAEPAASGPFNSGPSDPAAEAPMILDAPTLPLGTDDNVRNLVGGTAADTGTAPGAQAEPTAEEVDEDDRQPAAVMLRAMDALRARDKRSELTSVYNRLSNLRQRLSRDGDSPSR